MSGIFTRLKDRFVRNNNNNRNNSSNRPPDNPCLSITRQSMRSNTTFCNAPMESTTFNSIVQDVMHTRAVSLAAIPLSTDVGDPDDIIPVRGVYQPQTHTISNRRASLPLDLIDDTRDLSSQQQYSRLYPTLPSFTPLQGMYAADQVYTERQTLYLTARGDTMNPNHDLPMAPLSQDEHYVSDAAMQQDGVPQVTSDTLALPLPSSSNIPTDYNQPHQNNQQTSTGHTSSQAQTTTTG